MHGLLTLEMVDRAYHNYLEPVLKNMMEKKLLRGPGMHLVFINPLMPYAGDSSDEAFEAAIFWEKSTGDQKNWPRLYDRIAREKARVTWRTSMPTRIVRECFPYMLAKGNSRYGGSVNNSGLIISGSGEDPWYDEAFSGILSYGIMGEANNYMQTVVIPGEQDFIE